jgi:hypothetical protein
VTPRQREQLARLAANSAAAASSRERAAKAGSTSDDKAASTAGGPSQRQRSTEPEPTPTTRRTSPRAGRARTEGSAEAAAPAAAAVRPPGRRAHRPLSQGELVKQLVKRVGNERPSRSSVRLARGPRGQVMPEVLVHVGDDPRIRTVDDAAAYAQSIFNLLCAAYPMFGDTGGNGGE